MNGFGSPETIAQENNHQRSLGVRVLYHGADMTKPEEIKDKVEGRKKNSEALISLSTMRASNTFRRSKTFRLKNGRPSLI